ncbi:Hypothetical predicted protein, partial [Paramuricea clavata]
SILINIYQSLIYPYLTYEKVIYLQGKLVPATNYVVVYELLKHKVCRNQYKIQSNLNAKKIIKKTSVRYWNPTFLGHFASFLVRFLKYSNFSSFCVSWLKLQQALLISIIMLTDVLWDLIHATLMQPVSLETGHTVKQQLHEPNATVEYTFGLKSKKSPAVVIEMKALNHRQTFSWTLQMICPLSFELSAINHKRNPAITTIMRTCIIPQATTQELYKAERWKEIRRELFSKERHSYIYPMNLLSPRHVGNNTCYCRNGMVVTGWVRICHRADSSVVAIGRRASRKIKSAAAGSRTRDLRITGSTLCLLSYTHRTILVLQVLSQAERCSTRRPRNLADNLVRSKIKRDADTEQAEIYYRKLNNTVICQT